MTDAVSADPEAGVIHCGWVRVARDGQQSTGWFARPVQDLFPELTQHNCFAVHACMVRRSLAESIGPFDVTLKTCPDWDFWQRIARTAPRFASVPEILACYRLRPASAGTRARQLLGDGLTVICGVTNPTRVCYRPLRAMRRGCPPVRPRKQSWSSSVGPRAWRSVRDSRRATARPGGRRAGRRVNRACRRIALSHRPDADRPPRRHMGTLMATRGDRHRRLPRCVRSSRPAPRTGRASQGAVDAQDRDGNAPGLPQEAAFGPAFGEDGNGFRTSCAELGAARRRARRQNRGVAGLDWRVGSSQGVARRATPGMASTGGSRRTAVGRRRRSSGIPDWSDTDLAHAEATARAGRRTFPGRHRARAVRP